MTPEELREVDRRLMAIRLKEILSRPTVKPGDARWAAQCALQLLEEIERLRPARQDK